MDETKCKSAVYRSILQDIRVHILSCYLQALEQPVRCGNPSLLPRSRFLSLHVAKEYSSDKVALCLIDPQLVPCLQSLSLLAVVRGVTRVSSVTDMVRFILTQDRLSVPPAAFLALPSVIHHHIGPNRIHEPVIRLFVDLPPDRVVFYAAKLGLNSTGGVTRTEAGYQLSLWATPTFHRVPLSLQPITPPDGAIEPAIFRLAIPNLRPDVHIDSVLDLLRQYPAVRLEDISFLWVLSPPATGWCIQLTEGRHLASASVMLAGPTELRINPRRPLMLIRTPTGYTTLPGYSINLTPKPPSDTRPSHRGRPTPANPPHRAWQAPPSVHSIAIAF